MEKKVGPKPFLKILQAMDLRGVDSGDVTKTVKETHGFVVSQSGTVSKTDTKEVHAEVSGQYGFSEISNVSATVGTSVSGSVSRTNTTETTLKTSRTTETDYIFKAGKFTGFYLWAVNLKGEVLILDAPVIGTNDPDEKKTLEKNVGRVELEGEAKNFMSEKDKIYYRNMHDQFKKNVTSASPPNYSTDGGKGFWNDWQKRDASAQTDNTYEYGRYSEKVSYWYSPWNNGTWYCHMTEEVAIAKGLPLDPS